MTSLPTYELYAIRYATNPRRIRGQNIILGEDPGRTEPMDFFSWVAIGSEGPIVIDTGMHPDKARRHGHDVLRSPMEGLRALGVEPEEVTRVVITHMHYDHVGNTEAFPKARFDMQAAEMAYVTGPFMEKAWFRRAYERDEVGRFVDYLYEGRLHLHGPEAEIAPGLTVHLVGGHCAGQEVVRVHTERGWVVLASDALHYYEEYDRTVPFTVAYNLSDMLTAHDRIRELARSDDHILPSHDPIMMERYPAARPDFEGAVIRLDVAPRRASVAAT